MKKTMDDLDYPSPTGEELHRRRRARELMVRRRRRRLFPVVGVAVVALGLGIAAAAGAFSPGSPTAADVPTTPTSTTETVPTSNGDTGTAFIDVPADHPYLAAIQDLAERGAMGGRPDGTFGPDEQLSRQQVAKVIVLALGIPVSEEDISTFTDVPVGPADDLYPDNYIAAAARDGIVTGNEYGEFLPSEDVTLLQLITMVLRAADSVHPGLIEEAAGPTTRAEAAGLLDGLQLTTGDLQQSAARGEAAQILHNLLDQVTTTT